MNSPAQQFNGLIQSYLHTATKLRLTLEQEYALLGNSDTTGMKDLAAAKGQHLAELSVFDENLGRLLKNAGFNNDKAGIAAFVEQHDAADELGLAKQWQEMMVQVAQCQRQNVVNGTVIELRQRATQHLLATLTGQTNSQTYDPTGKTQSGSTSQSLAKA